VAILLELARLLPPDTTPVTLVFFDQEDNGSLDGRQWIVGSTAFVQSLTYKPDCAIIVDMVGDTNLNLPFERDSTPDLVKSIWGTAARLGYYRFRLSLLAHLPGPARQSLGHKPPCGR
jgi:hypothetical protein